MKSKIFKRSVWAIVTLFFAILMGIFIVLQDAVVPYERWIDNFFGVRRTFLVNDEGEEEKDTQYYKSKYPIDLEGHKKMQAEALEVTERVNEEGMVLLWNKDDALPLDAAKEQNVSTFGVQSLSHDDGTGKIVDLWPYHGTGSANVDLRQDVGILSDPGLDIGPRLTKSLESHGFHCNQALLDATWEHLEDKANPNGYDAVMGGLKRTRKEVSWSQLQNDSRDPIGETVSAYGDVAIYTVGRITGEGGSLSDELNLTAEEQSVLQGLSELRSAGKIKKVILVIAFANSMNINAFKDYHIDACLWVGYGGNTSTEALVDVLVGEANPSGHLTDTWAYEAASAPAAVNYGDFRYGGKVDEIDNDPDIGETNDRYIVYQEGIYVGYRYYETRYEDAVLGGRNADAAAGVVAGSGAWSYADEVAYPFGYGLSYTDFEYSDYTVEKDGSDYHVGMTITNVGDRAGKEVMQVYLQKPYTDYDREHGIEKAAVELVGFAKTKELAPGESQELTVTVPEYEFKCYDAYGERTYILEKGDYYLTAATDAHEAVNNILAAKGYTVADGMTVEGDAELVSKHSYLWDDRSTYAVSLAGAEVTNRFDDADVNLYEGTRGQEIVYLSRSDWKATWPSSPVSLSASDEIVAALAYEQPVPENADDVMPVYGKESAEYGHLNLIQLRDVPYEDPLWDDLLDQLTFEEQISLLKGSALPIESITAPEGDVYDGPCGLRDSYLGDLGARLAFPCSPIVASTFNQPLMEEMGESFAEVAVHHGRTGIWGVSTNIHRLPYNGRNWEYYSEDGFLAGKSTAAETRGLVKHGITVYTKHFALNEMEKNRNGVNTWANEQSIREIYLKAFEAGITEANGNGIMTSFNRIGCTWTGAHIGLLQNVLREEWGFIGVTATDWCSFQYMGIDNPSILANAVIAGQDEWIYDIVQDQLLQYKDNATFCLALRESAHRNLYTRVHSVAMNGVGTNTRVVFVTPDWQKAIDVVAIVAGCLTGACAVMTALSWVFWFRDRRKG